MEYYDVQVTVKSILKGECPAGHKVGDTWLITKNQTPGGMCMLAFQTVFPVIRVWQYSDKNPWGEDKDVTYRVCPDPKVLVVFEIKRLRPAHSV